MNRAEFEADLLREGYEVREGGLEPNIHRPAHSHDFNARVMVLDGSITLVFGDERCVYGPGARVAFRPRRLTSALPRSCHLTA